MCLHRFIIFILVIMKSFGSRPMILKRFFSEVIEASKIKRKSRNINNYYVPILSEERKQSVKKVVSIQISGTYLICTTILREGNILADWTTMPLPVDMSKFNLNDVYNSVTGLMKVIPESDIYVIENYVKMPTNVNITGANLFYVKLQTLAMIIALINKRQTVNSPSDTQPSNRVVLMKARLHARLFRIIIGSEIISSQEITELMLKGTFPEYVTPIVPGIDAILSYNSVNVKEPVLKELMSNGLMLAMTFIDLVLNSNQKSIKALNESSRRKFKKNTKDE